MLCCWTMNFCYFWFHYNYIEHCASICLIQGWKRVCIELTWMEWTQRHENEICPPVWWHIAWPIHSAYVLCYILFAETKPRFICKYSSVEFEFYFVILFHSRCSIIGNRWLCNNLSYRVVQFKCWFKLSLLFYNHSYTTIY